VLVPRLLGWSSSELPSETRKALEVALHVGSALALAPAAARRVPRERGSLGLLSLTFAPPALAGLAFERPIERRLGHPRAVAIGLAVGALGLAIADRAPGRRTRPGALDHLGVGIGQAAALAPGVSRHGAAMTAARLRGLDRGPAARLSLAAALPVTAGAAVLKGVRLARAGFAPELRAPFAAGGLAALCSTALALPFLRPLESGTSWRPFAAYRLALAGLALARGRPRP
jgi:undecaprenyl-diphosphatase